MGNGPCFGKGVALWGLCDYSLGITHLPTVSVAPASPRRCASRGGIYVGKAFATRAIAVASIAALGIAGSISPASAADPGVTKSKITIGMTTPLTGPAAPGYKDIAPAAKAYFKYVNANGGINGAMRRRHWSTRACNGPASPPMPWSRCRTSLMISW